MSETAPIRLTQLAKRAGCAAKLPPGALLPLLGGLPPIVNPAVLVGNSTADDAAVYQLDADRSLVFTTDFFTPIVDRPYDFGAVAATNALSDVYAMGGRPLCALNIAGFPDDKLPLTVLAEIMRGAAEKGLEAGCPIVGGHTIRSEEPIFGLAVVGEVHPQQILGNTTARPDHALILTKPIGTGIITTAAKNGEDKLNAIGDALRWMTTLNRTALEVLRAHGVCALTDITGFGLLGHLRNITAGSGVGAEIRFEAVPFYPAAIEYCRAGIAPGGTHGNWKFLNEWTTYAGLSKEEQLLLCDAQTSGGLLGVVPNESAIACVSALRHAGWEYAAIVGRTTASNPGKITVVRESPSRA